MRRSRRVPVASCHATGKSYALACGEDVADYEDRQAAAVRRAGAVFNRKTAW
jgi:hypothetical protein